MISIESGIVVDSSVDSAYGSTIFYTVPECVVSVSGCGLVTMNGCGFDGSSRGIVVIDSSVSISDSDIILDGPDSTYIDADSQSEVRESNVRKIARG